MERADEWNDAMTEPCVSGLAKLDVQATLDGCELNLSVTVPTGPTHFDDLFPLLTILSDRIVESAEKEAVELGHAISCRKGCGACCRQLVPVSPVEARHIARLVARMPEPRRQEIVRRFADARRRLEEAGLWEGLSRRQGVKPLPIGMEYFRLGIACPFLEDESCSIHPDRPLTCREFVVVTPAENCSNPTPATVKSLRLAASVWVTAARCEPGTDDADYITWVPLIRALEWFAEQTEPPAETTGPEFVRRIFENLPGSNQGDPALPLPT
jgi:Fe-S-cluster containining protein